MLDLELVLKKMELDLVLDPVLDSVLDPGQAPLLLIYLHRLVSNISLAIP